MSNRPKRAPSISQRLMTTFTSWPFSGASPSSPRNNTAGGKQKLKIKPGTTITSTTYTSASAIGKPVSIHVPAEIVDMIIAQVKLAHNCRTCYVRDLASLSLVNKSFHAAVEDSLYTSVQIHDGLSRRSWTGGSNGGNSSSSAQKSGVAQQPMALLLRTLTEAPALARLIRVLDLSVDPDAQPEEAAETYKLIAGIISACANLRSFKGDTAYFPQPMNGNKASAVGKALYAAKSLQEHSWWATIYQAGYVYFGFNLDTFVSYHDNWEELETLVLRGWRTDRPLNKPLTELHFLRIWKRLSMRQPRVWHEAFTTHNDMDYDFYRESYETKKKKPLKRLYLSKYTVKEFTPSALEAVAFAFPELQALRLERVAGITRDALLSWATHVSSDAVQALSTDLSSRLESLTITECVSANLGATELCTLLLSLPHLRKFIFRPWKDTFKTAELSEEEKSLVLEEESKGWPSMEYQPVLSHEKLEYLFWQVVPPMPANYWLYYSIISRGLPKLRTITAPNDKNGLLQSLCKRVINPAREEKKRLAKMVPKRVPGAVVRKAWRRAANEMINPSPPPPLPLNLVADENRNTTCDEAIIEQRRRKLPGMITFDLRCQHPHCHSFLLQDRDLCWVKTGRLDDPENMYDEDDELEETALDHLVNLADDESSQQPPTQGDAAADVPTDQDNPTDVDMAELLLDFSIRFPGLLPPGTPDMRALTPSERLALLPTLPADFRILLQDHARTLTNNAFAERNPDLTTAAVAVATITPRPRRLAPHEYEGEDYTCEYGDNAEYGDERDLRRQLAVQKECEVGGTWCNGKWNSPKGLSGNGGGNSSTSPVLERKGSLIARTASMSWRGGGAGRRGSVKERNWWHVPRPVEDLGRDGGGLKDFF